MLRCAARRLAAFAFVVLAVAGCETPPTRAFPEITFANRPAIGLDVAQVEVIQTYQPTLQDPQIEHLFPQVPSQVMQRWARERIRPMGMAGVARVYIEQASVRSDQLARTPGLQGLFTVDQAERLTANFAIRLEVQTPSTSGYATASVERTTTVPENATLAEREEIWFRLTEDAMEDLDARIESAIRSNLSLFVRS